MTSTAPATAILPTSPTRLTATRARRSGPLSDHERTEATTMRARAAAELMAIEDGLLGRGWRVRRRAAYLTGFIRGATACLEADAAARN